MDSQSSEGMPSPKRQNMREPNFDKGLRDRNGKFTGDFLPHRKYKMIEQWNFSEDEYQSFLRDIDALINTYLDSDTDEYEYNQFTTRLVHYGLSETWVPKLEETFTKRRAMDFLQTFMTARLRNRTTRYSQNLSPPSIPQIPRPRLALTPKGRAQMGQPQNIVDRFDRWFKEAESTNSHDGHKRTRLSSESENDHPQKIKKMSRGSPTESSQDVSSVSYDQSTQVSTGLPGANSQLDWPTWGQIQIRINYEDFAGNYTRTKQHAISLVLCCDVTGLSSTPSVCKLEDQAVAPDLLSYAHLIEVLEEKWDNMDAKFDFSYVRFESLGYSGSTACIDTSIGFNQAFRLWWREPLNRTVNTKTGLIIWWLMAKTKTEDILAQEEEIEMPDFSSLPVA